MPGGLWQDLTPYMQADQLSIDDFAPAAITYTNFGGKQCALPSLTDAFGLYYNTEMFAKAGIAEPPKTMDELMADAKKLTVRNPDGASRWQGSSRSTSWEQLGPGDLANAWGAKWFDDAGQAAVLGTDPGWAAALHWQRQLIDWYGYDNITKFFAANTNNEFNPSNAFEKGKVAMTFDGEWRNGVHQGRAASPDLSSTARRRSRPLPTIPSMYGSSPRRRDDRGHPQGREASRPGVAAGEVPGLRHQYLVQMANSVGNVPTTRPAIASPDLKLPPQFNTFLQAWANRSRLSHRRRASGGGYANLLDTFDGEWQAGKIT